eukprot:TRINITY_DN58698_c0_g1_i1.p1 TRINITY_DN58698_c0_g1~~TRINITY_DN58698_c0_g1_i1.p1  ORF type:complete len:176 (+),score=23.65 TRINITY_DN58698_c0_g1_i1:30-557(+)
MTSEPSCFDEDPRLVAPYLPTRNEVIWQAVGALQHRIKGAAGPFLELGSGDGRISHYVAKTFGVRTVGLELNADLVSQANSLAEDAGVSDLCEFRTEDIMDMAWASEEWSGVFLYLLPEALAKLEDVLLGLRCPVICISFRLPTATPSESASGWAMYNLPEAISDGNDRADMLFG